MRVYFVTEGERGAETCTDSQIDSIYRNLISILLFSRLSRRLKSNALKLIMVAYYKTEITRALAVSTTLTPAGTDYPLYRISFAIVTPRN